MMRLLLRPSGWRDDGGGREKSSECEESERHEEGEGTKGEESGEGAPCIHLLLLLLIDVDRGPGTAAWHKMKINFQFSIVMKRKNPTEFRLNS